MKKLIVGFVMVSFLFSAGVFAAVDSIKVSGDITQTAVTRNLSGEASGLGLDAATVMPDAQDYIASQVRLRFDAALTEGVSAVVSLINERIWGQEADSTTNVDLDLAYIQLEEFMSPNLTLIVGRQNLRYGNGLIIGDPDTNRVAGGGVAAGLNDISMRKAFDAVRAVIDYSPYIIDLIYAKVDENTTSVNDDVTLFGVNLAYAWQSQAALTEFYAFGTDVEPNSRVSAAGVQDENSHTYVAGARVMNQLTDSISVGVEAAYQGGDVLIGSVAAGITHKKRSAYALQAVTAYNFLDEQNSSLNLSYTLLSGDDDGMSGGDDFTGWDPMFEDQVAGEILNILGANTNAHFIRLAGSTMPKEDVTIGAVLAHAMLAEKYNPVTGSGLSMTTYSPLAGPAANNLYTVDRNDNNFGDELDVYAVYDYTEDVQLKILGGMFIPGNFFASANDQTMYSVRGSMSVNF